MTSSLAPTGYLFGPVSMVMSIVENTGWKGIAQHVAVAGDTAYIASIWVRPDRDCGFRIAAVPESGTTVTTDANLTAGTWTLVQLEWAPTADGYGDVQYITDEIGIFEVSCAQLCRKVDDYNPAVHVIPNEWTRGGLADDLGATFTIERFDDAAPYTWSEVLAETVGTATSWQLKRLAGGALTYSLRDVYFPLNTELWYRGRVNHDSLAVSSPDSGALPVASFTDPRWLLVPTLPGRTGEFDSGDVLSVHLNSETFDSDSADDSGIFYGLGRRNAIVVTDTTVQGESGTLSLSFSDAASADIFERIRDAQCPVLLRAGSYGFQRWIQFAGGQRRRSIFLGTGNVRPAVTVAWVEVDPPKNA
jgi:hypothetical protein